MVDEDIFWVRAENHVAVFGSCSDGASNVGSLNCDRATRISL